ncbi:mannosyl-oligosaccharide 1,2-alpha-mannosidase MNS3-like isoform X2 [Cucurbita pepo subsp. pepo]|uniref:mannosyl-oligosaccharide 1,2-alpha-mannosidase MNS3-like isoform X2 n=1 Tax=Cucurbita pepo subsp. pepo TaxID=3664 RepID=UPI000C9D7F2C|nr:mannosyl-oligosaccharide 1,2-alpha-mannosidase MNS3-like isoform X2 [Cucurbita pepo subsp. pepo]
MSSSLPYSVKDVHYDNAKFRQRSYLKVMTQNLLTGSRKRECLSCSTGKFLVLLLVFGLAYLFLTSTPVHVPNQVAKVSESNEKGEFKINGGINFKNLWRRAPRLPPRLPPDEKGSNTSYHIDPNMLVSESLWISRQQKVKDAFIHAWSGYKRYAMGNDELMPLSQTGTDGLGGLGATIVDALDTAMIMGASDIVSEAGSWVEKHLLDRIKEKGDPKYSVAAMKVLEHMKSLPKVEGLVPIYISPDTGDFIGETIRLGSRGDSYYEYLLKVWIQKGMRENNNFTYLHDMYDEAMKGVKHLLVRKSVPNGLVFVGELPYGSNAAFSPKMDHLVCFLPGTLALGATKGMSRDEAMRESLLSFDDLENLKLAEDLAKTCFEMYEVTSTGLAPEIAYFHTEEYSEQGLGGGNKKSKYIDDIIIKSLDRHNLLRPETVESLFVLYRITGNPKYRAWGWQIFEAFERHTKVSSGGYTSLDDVTSIPPRRRDKMETFFLGETLKYLYLLFGDSSAIPLDKYVFNSEAHPLPIEGNAPMK